MDKKIIKTEKRLCPCCMEEHDVKTVIVNETSAFKDTKVEYGACYLYCDKADEYYMDEHQIRNNGMSLKNAYRKKKVCLLLMRSFPCVRNTVSPKVTCVLCLAGAEKLLPDTKAVRYRIKHTIRY